MIKTIAIILATILIPSGLAVKIYFKTQASINLIAPTNYSVGDLVVLDAEESPGTLQWTILPETKNFKIVGKTAYFSSSTAIPYTVFISGTTGGTLATKVYFLIPRSPVEPKNPNLVKISRLLNGGVITSLDDAEVIAKQLDIDIPDFKTLEELKEWIADNS